MEANLFVVSGWVYIINMVQWTPLNRATTFLTFLEGLMSSLNYCIYYPAAVIQNWKIGPNKRWSLYLSCTLISYVAFTVQMIDDDMSLF